MGEMRVIKYQMNYRYLNKKMYETNRKLYDQVLILLRLSNLQNKCAYMVRANKPRTSGTKVTFAVVENTEQYRKEIQKLTEDAKKNGFTIKEKEEGENHD